MFGFLTLGTTLLFTDQACKGKIEEQKYDEFPQELEGSKGMIRLHKNHNAGFCLGLFKGSKAVETVPLYLNSGLAGIWLYLMGMKGRVLEKLAVTLVLAGGISNLYDRMKRGYVVDYFSIQWKFLKKLVFNLGDIFIFLGSGMMLAAGLADAMKDTRRKK